MSTQLYNRDILRLAASLPFSTRLPNPMGSAERRSTACGSRAAIDVDLDDGGRVRAVGMEVRACALGQASAAILADAVIGRSVAELRATYVELVDWLNGTGPAPDWPQIEVLAPALPHRGRHSAIQLPFLAARDASVLAAGQV